MPDSPKYAAPADGRAPSLTHYPLYPLLLANPLEINIFRVIDAWSDPRLAETYKDRERQHERGFQATGTENRNAKGQERMKKTLTAVALLAGAVTGFSQGQINMNDYSGTFAIQVFTASSLAASTVSVSYGGYTVLEQQGNPYGPLHPLHWHTSGGWL